MATKQEAERPKPETRERKAPSDNRRVMNQGRKEYEERRKKQPRTATGVHALRDECDTLNFKPLVGYRFVASAFAGPNTPDPAYSAAGFGRAQSDQKPSCGCPGSAFLL